MSHAEVARAGVATRAPRASRRAPMTVRVVGFFRRAVAAVVDLLIVSAAATVASASALWVLGADARGRPLGADRLLDAVASGDPRLVGVALIALFVSLIYGSAFVSLLSATPGMRLLGCRIITIHGARPTAPRALLRLLAFFVALAPLGLGVIWAAFDREKRGLHDWIAGTLVIAARRDGPPPGEARP